MQWIATISISALYDELEKWWHSQPVGDTKSANDDVASHLSNLLLVLAAGHESTAFLLGTIMVQSKLYGGLLAMLNHHSDQFDLLVDEAIRFDPPVQLIGRTASREVVVCGRKAAKGERVYFHIGAANRDEEVYENANRFVVGRARRPDISFGLGASHCIGAMLAKRGAIALLQAIRSKCKDASIDYDSAEYANGYAGREFGSIRGYLA
jgi:cytochrome P450